MHVVFEKQKDYRKNFKKETNFEIDFLAGCEEDCSQNIKCYLWAFFFKKKKKRVCYGYYR